MKIIDTYYNKRIDALKLRIKEKTKKIRWVGTARLAAFVGIILSFVIWKSAWPAWSVALLCFALFLVLIKRNGLLQKQRNRSVLMRDFYEKHKAALRSWDYAHFGKGEQFIQPGHPFANDISIFGKNGLFQMVARGHALFGQRFVGKALNELSSDATVIKQRQQVVKEMAQKPDFMEELHVLLHEKVLDQQKFDVLENWMQFELSNQNRKQLKWSIAIQSLLFAGSVMLTTLGWLPSSVMFIPFVSMLFLMQPFFKRINVLLGKTDKLSEFLTQLSRIMRLIETRDVKSAILLKSKADLLKKNHASTELEGMVKAFQMLEYRQNPIVGFILNFTCLWDAIALLRVESIKSKVQKHFETWRSSIETFDGYSSLGRFAFDHDEAVFPTISKDETRVLKASELGHPFISPSKRVANNFEIAGSKEIKIVTGANMAGKSTFLRTIGVSIVMASAGLPVMAASFEYVPMLLFTSMLTSDDLSEEKSYFLSEVERLANMVHYKNQHPQTLLIMDEILKGTNSHDKELGSRLFIERLVLNNAGAIIATHDIGLTNLSETHWCITNHCFEVETKEGRMHFDYKLRDGVTQNMNALQLMKKKGLIDS